MPDSLFSPMWYRIAGLHPRLRPHVRVQRQKYRDQVWYRLVDGTTGRQHRINHAAYQFIGRCNGQRSVAQLWDTMLQQLVDDAPTQDDIIRLLAQLGERELIQCEITPDIEALFRRHAEHAHSRRRASVNPLAFRLPLFDPTRLLDRIERPLRPLLRAPALWLWAACVLVATLAAASNWEALHAHARTYMSTPRYLLLAWLCFPLIKTLHELGHALSVRRWGGDVHEMGISLLMLTPAPYVDASAAMAFRHRYQRVIVSAAGIMVEVLLAAAALFVWLNVQPGLVRDIAFVILFIGSVSTLLVNGNPLLRFDGYHVLCDALDLPNLAPRSQAYWIYLTQRYVLRMEHAASPQPAAGERKWLVVYAPLSWAYRLFVAGLVLLWVGAKSWLLGWVAALLLVAAFLVKPAFAAVKVLLSSVPPGRARRRAHAAIAGLIGGMAILIFAVPLPLTTLAQGVVWLPEQAQVRAETEGFVRQILVPDGTRVEPGQVLLVLSDPTLGVAREKLQSRLSGLQTEHYSAMLSDPVRAQNVTEDIARTQAEIGRIEQRIAQLDVRSQVAGTLVIPHRDDLPGAFVRQGTTLGYVLGPAQLSVRAAVAEEDVDLVRHRTRKVEVRLAEAADETILAQLRRDTPTATNTLPSAALGDRAGGRYMTDPSDKDGLRTLQSVFLVDLQVPARTLERVGIRVWVRFDHGTETLASQWYRRASQLLLKHFNPT